MIAWMVYLTAVACVTSVAGLLAEHGLRRLGRPVRWSWLGAMAATVAVPVVAAVGAAPGGLPDAARIGIEIPVASGSSTVEVLVIAGWAGLSLILLASVRLSSWTVRRNERSWRRVRSMAPHETVVSSGFGPGVVGARRPRIVLPEWVLEAAPSLRDLIVRHEEEHVRARDTTLLLAAVGLGIMLPWCLPLWWQLHRLRCAVEIDCDARVLAATQAPREYAGALLQVAGRRTRGLLPAPPFSLWGGELERRIRIMTDRGQGGSRLVGAGLLLGAVALVVTPAAVATPDLPALRVDPGPAMPDAPAAATVYLQIDPGARGPGD